ncbi:MAG: dioxygenase [Proteobacteria bacterium]|jgi:protocatechuate 3,4-dioxygenase beta subunit|nr:dioxygenase [Pseudomonadota bacterium]MDA1136135.1 dioxygenase [Pseudomonadota bacterium]|tara:strand:- start:3176 stop:4012 length:837 start_codon:yes stop_codon:yes gene_type:complete
MDFNEKTATNAVLDSFSSIKNDRLKFIMNSIVTHLHEVVKEVEPTEEEWLQAIMFLTNTGQKCDDRRQEFILLSDVLGVSMLVDSINNRKSKNETETTVLGPFHTPSPKVNMGDNIANNVNGEKCIVSGKVLDTNNNPIVKATIEVWQSGPDGLYDVQKEGHTVDLRGTMSSLDNGSYFFQTVKPQYYPIPVDGPVGKVLNSLERHPFRPAHIHFMVKAEGYESLVTHVFIDGDKYLESDTVFAVKKSLIRKLEHGNDTETGEKCFYLNFDIVMEKTI